MKLITNLFILFFILIVVGFLYKRFEDKLKSETNENIYEAIQKYLLTKHHITHIHIKQLNFVSNKKLIYFLLNNKYNILLYTILKDE